MPLIGRAKETRQLPPTVATDEVLPVHMFDGSSAARGIILVWTYKFDDILDPHKIHDALTTLFQMPGWRKFSGRFRPRTDGRLEIHVPEKSTKLRPAVFLSTEEHGYPMSQHPLASTLPEPTGDVATFPGPRKFTPLALGPDSPRTLDDFIYGGKPQFCLHIQTFTDGTLLGLAHTHISTDLGGYMALLDAWRNVLAGRLEAVPPLMGYRDDPFKEFLYPPAKESHRLSDKVLSGWRFKYWAMRSLFESWRAVEVEARTVCIPKRVIAAMVKEARGHIASEGKFISTGDILTAAACRVRAQAEGPGSTREVMTIMALNPRGHAKNLMRPDAAYVLNSPANVHFSCPADKALTLPLGQLALLVRQAISDQISEEQLRASVALSVETMKEHDLPVIFGTKDMATQFLSNWSMGRISDRMDFSPAIVKDAERRPSPKSKRGHPTYWSLSDPSHNTVSVISSLYVVVGEDVHENTWLTLTVAKPMWEDFMAFVRRYDDDGQPGQVKARL